MEATIFNIQRFSIHDGPGIRTTIFLKGCPLRCWWCHNPEGLENKLQVVQKKIRMEGKDLLVHHTFGRKYSLDKILSEILKDRIFMEESQGGVTFSGGEPLMQYPFLKNLLKACQRNELHTAIDTSGYAPQKAFLEVLPYTDLFLFDLKIMEESLHQKYTGNSNVQILKNFKLLMQKNAKVHVRIPLIPGITDQMDNSQRMVRFLAPFRHKIKQITLLPYHATAKQKYHLLQFPFQMDESLQLSKEKVTSWIDEFQRHQLPIQFQEGSLY